MLLRAEREKRKRVQNSLNADPNAIQLSCLFRALLALSFASVRHTSGLLFVLLVHRTGRAVFVYKSTALARRSTAGQGLSAECASRVTAMVSMVLFQCTVRAT